MSANFETTLRRAYDLIEEGKQEEARVVLKPLLDFNKENADLWWLYAHAVDDLETARLALNNVLSIDRDYPDASELLVRLENNIKQSHQEDWADSDGKEPFFIPGIDDLAFDSDTDDHLNDHLDTRDEPFYRRPLFYVPLLSMLLILALAVVIFRPFAVNSPAYEETDSAQIQLVASAEPSVNNFEAAETILDGLQSAQLNATSIYVVSTNLGETIVADVCTNLGSELRQNLSLALETLAKSDIVYAGDIEAISARMIDCTTTATQRWIGVSNVTAQAYKDAAITDAEFQGEWIPVSN